MQFAESFSIFLRYALYSARLASVVIGLLLLPTALVTSIVVAPVVLLLACCGACSMGNCIRDILDDEPGVSTRPSCQPTSGACRKRLPSLFSCFGSVAWVETLVCYYMLLGGWPLALVAALGAIPIAVATGVVFLPCCCGCVMAGCVDLDDIDDDKFSIFLVAGLWPWVLALAMITLALGLASIPLILPITLFFGCRSRPPLNQHDGNLGAVTIVCER